MSEPLVLVLAGRDPTGGAGVDADDEAIRAAGAYARLIVTTETEQDGVRVQSVRGRPESLWEAEARAAIDEAPPLAVKTGLLSSAAAVSAAVRIWRQTLEVGARWLVVDPVLRASGGEVFLDAEGQSRLLSELLPAGALLTPNLPELAALTGFDQERLEREPESRLEAAEVLLGRGARGVCVKAGHGREQPLRELLALGDAAPTWFERERIRGAGIHGSGCRHASYLAARLALGDDPVQAAERAGEYTAELLRARS